MASHVVVGVDGPRLPRRRVAVVGRSGVRQKIALALDGCAPVVSRERRRVRDDLGGRADPWRRRSRRRVDLDKPVGSGGRAGVGFQSVLAGVGRLVPARWHSVGNRPADGGPHGQRKPRRRVGSAPPMDDGVHGVVPRTVGGNRGGGRPEWVGNRDDLVDGGVGLVVVPPTAPNGFPPADVQNPHAHPNAVPLRP